MNAQRRIYEVTRRICQILRRCFLIDSAAASQAKTENDVSNLVLAGRVNQNPSTEM